MSPNFVPFHTTTPYKWVSYTSQPYATGVVPVLTDSPYLVTSDVIAKAEPGSMHEGFTRFLSVNCNFSRQQTSDFTTIMSLILSKTGSSDGVYSEIASMTVNSKNRVNVINRAVGAEVTGRLVSGGASFISLEWKHPPREAKGTYRCQAYGLDQAGHPRFSSSTATVGDRSVNFDLVLQRLKEMDKAVDELQAYKAATSKHLEDSQSVIMEASAQYRGHVYHLSRRVVRNVPVADSLCQLFGGRLVELNDIQEFSFVADFVNLNQVNESVAVGATDEDHEGSWTLLNAGIPMAVTGWAVGQPDGGPRENCMYLAPDSTDMHDDVCFGRSWMRFVCET